MEDLLLLPGKILDGPTRVTVTARPERIAYLVDPNDPTGALAAIEAMCLGWGGQHQFLIPCASGDEPNPIWKRILEKHDPDIIVDLVGAGGDYASERWDRWGRWISRREIEPDIPLQFGAPVHVVLRRRKRLSSPGTVQQTWHMTPLAGHPIALPLAFRWGHLVPRLMDAVSGRSWPYEFRHSEFLEVRTIDPFELSDERIVQLVTEYPLAPSTPEQPGLGPLPSCTLPELTSLYLPQREWAKYVYHNGSPYVHPEYGQQYDESFLRRIVVVGDPLSVSDLCLAWNLRAQRASDSPSPIWVSPQWLREPIVVDRLMLAFDQQRVGPAEDAKVVTVHLVSASLAPDELEKEASALPSYVVHDRAEIDRFFTADYRTGLSEQSVVSFRRGTAELVLPDFMQLGDFDGNEFVNWTLSIADYSIPRGSWNLYPRLCSGVCRVAKDGIAGGATGTGNRFNQRVLYRVGMSSDWEIASGLAEQAGYRVEISDKGRLAIAMTRLLGGPAGFSVLASSRVYALLTSMAEIVSRQAVQSTLRRQLGREPSAEEVDDHRSSLQQTQIEGGQFDRQHQTSDRIMKSLGDASRNVRKGVLTWLVEQRVLFRGYVIVCPNCGVKRWYPIDRLGQTHHCDGCQIVQPVPLAVDQSLNWYYRLNELVAQAVDQGVLPHLLALHRMGWWADSLEPDLLGFLPGVQLKPIASDGPPDIEVDLLAIKGGRIVIGECKRSGGELAEYEVDRFAALAARLDCSRIVYASPSDFGEASEIIAHARAVTPPAYLEVWDRDVLLDPWIFLRLEPGAQFDPQANPGLRQDRPTVYLEEIEWSLRRSIHP